MTGSVGRVINYDGQCQSGYQLRQTNVSSANSLIIFYEFVFLEKATGNKMELSYVRISLVRCEVIGISRVNTVCVIYFN